VLCHGPNTAPRSVRRGYSGIILFKEDLEKSRPASVLANITASYLSFIWKLINNIV
jgi:hypothetical protein